MGWWCGSSPSSAGKTVVDTEFGDTNLPELVLVVSCVGFLQNKFRFVIAIVSAIVYLSLGRPSDL